MKLRGGRGVFPDALCPRRAQTPRPSGTDGRTRLDSSFPAKCTVYTRVRSGRGTFCGCAQREMTWTRYYSVTQSGFAGAVHPFSLPPGPWRPPTYLSCLVCRSPQSGSLAFGQDHVDCVILDQTGKNHHSRFFFFFF